MGAVPVRWTQSNTAGQGETDPSTLARRQAPRSADCGSSSPQVHETVSVVMPRALAEMSSDQLMMLAFAKRSMERMHVGQQGLAT